MARGCVGIISVIMSGADAASRACSNVSDLRTAGRSFHQPHTDHFAFPFLGFDVSGLSGTSFGDAIRKPSTRVHLCHCVISGPDGSRASSSILWSHHPCLVLRTYFPTTSAPLDGNHSQF